MKRGRKSWKELSNEPFDYNYGTINGKYSKYERGEVITDLATLLDQEKVIFVDRCVHQEYIRSLQVRFVLSCLKRNSFYKAKLKKEVL